MHFKEFTKTAEFFWSHFNIEDGRERKPHFQNNMLYYFKVKTQLKHKERLVKYIEKVLWLIRCAKSGLPSFMVEISCWTMLHGWADQLKATAIKLRHGEQWTLFHMGDKWHTQNINSTTENQNTMVTAFIKYVWAAHEEKKPQPSWSYFWMQFST